jgi:hypothetical protein
MLKSTDRQVVYMPKAADSPTSKSVLDKVIGYFFNPEHKIGWPKGQWFIKALAFNPNKPDHVKMLTRQICFDSSRALFRGTTRFGEKYDLFLSITGPNGKTIDGIKTVWLKDYKSHNIRLITIIPPDKKN